MSFSTGLVQHDAHTALFARIMDAVTRFDDYFKEKENAAGKMGCHPYQKITACFRMLANACSADSLDAELRMSKTTIIDNLKLFAAVVHIFGPQYLQCLIVRT